MLVLALAPHQFDNVKATLARQTPPVILGGTSGEIAYDHCEGKYNYSDGLLRIDVTKKPMFVSESYVENRLSQFIAAVAGPM